MADRLHGNERTSRPRECKPDRFSTKVQGLGANIGRISFLSSAAITRDDTVVFVKGPRVSRTCELYRPDDPYFGSGRTVVVTVDRSGRVDTDDMSAMMSIFPTSVTPGEIVALCVMELMS